MFQNSSYFSSGLNSSCLRLPNITCFLKVFLILIVFDMSISMNLLNILNVFNILRIFCVNNFRIKKTRDFLTNVKIERRTNRCNNNKITTKKQNYYVYD